MIPATAQTYRHNDSAQAIVRALRSLTLADVDLLILRPTHADAQVTGHSCLATNLDKVLQYR